MYHISNSPTAGVMERWCYDAVLGLELTGLAGDFAAAWASPIALYIFLHSEITMNVSVLTLELGAKQNSGRTNENADDKKN
jgi:hypothetical protein